MPGRHKSARAFSCSSSSQTPYPSFPPQRGENSLIPLLLLSPANPLRWASPGTPVVVLRSGANSGPNPARICWEGQGLCPSRHRGTQRPTGAGMGRSCALISHGWNELHAGLLRLPPRPLSSSCLFQYRHLLAYSSITSPMGERVNSRLPFRRPLDLVVTVVGSLAMSPLSSN